MRRTLSRGTFHSKVLPQLLVLRADLGILDGVLYGLRQVLGLPIDVAHILLVGRAPQCLLVVVAEQDGILCVIGHQSERSRDSIDLPLLPRCNDSANGLEAAQPSSHIVDCRLQLGQLAGMTLPAQVRSIRKGLQLFRMIAGLPGVGLYVIKDVIGFLPEIPGVRSRSRLARGIWASPPLQTQREAQTSRRKHNRSVGIVSVSFAGTFHRH